MEASDADAFCAVLAAVDGVAGLEAMADHAHLTVAAAWRQRMHRAFEGVEGVDLAVVGRQGERAVVVVAAGVADGHLGGEKREGMRERAVQGPRERVA